MKKLYIATAAAAMILAPTLARADYSSSKNASNMETYNHVEINRPAQQGGPDYVFTIDNTDSIAKNKHSGRHIAFPIADGQTVRVRGNSIFLVDTDGVEAYAPNGQYTAPSGLTYVAEDGIVLRTEAPDQTAYVYTDDGLNVEVKDKK